MNNTSKYLAATLFVAVSSLAPQAHAATEQQTLVNRASKTLADLRSDKEFGNARDLAQKARAIMIIPRLYKGGFIFGGEGGGGVMMVHSPSGAWSQPAFYDIGSASFGFQAGLERSEMVVFIMSQKALDALNADEFKIGADAGVTVATLGSGVGGATTANAGADIITWASSTGAYAGISLNGSVVRPDKANNAAYYGRAARPQDIMYTSQFKNAGDAHLRADAAALK